MKKLLLLTIGVLTGAILFAQQAPQFTQYSQSRYIINPAATGVDEFVNINLGVRKQWSGLGQEPTTYYLGAHKGIRLLQEQEREPLALRTSRPDAFHAEQKEAEPSNLKHGIGGYVLSDESGAFKNNLISLSYALHLKLTEDISVSFGANTGFHNMNFDESKAIPTELNDPKYQSFITERGSLSMIDVNMGTYIYSKDFFFGYSTNQLLGDKISFGTTSNNVLVVHHNIMGGYTIQAGEDFKITPSILTKVVGGAPLSMDINFKADYQDKYFAGVSYRNQDAIALMIGGYFSDKFMVSYSYDLNTSVLKNGSSGGHEIVLGYMLKK